MTKFKDGFDKSIIDLIADEGRGITGTGTIGNSFYTVHSGGTLRIAIENAGVTNVVEVLASIRGAAFISLGTVTGSNNAIFDISTYDNVRLSCTVYGGTEFDLYASEHCYNSATEISLADGQSVDSAVDGQDKWRITTMDVGDTATAIPPTPFADRNSIQVFNTDAVETLYLGDSASVVAIDPGGTTTVYGYIVLARNEWQVDFTDAAPIFAIAPAGKTIRVQIVEIGKS